MPQKYRQRKRYTVSPAATQTTETVVIRHGKGTTHLMDFGTYFWPNLATIAEDTQLSTLDLRVLLLGIAVMDRHQRIPLTQAQMAKRLDASRPAVNRSVRTLVDKGYILRAGRTYTVNSRIATKQTLLEVQRYRSAEAKPIQALIERDRQEAITRQREAVHA